MTATPEPLPPELALDTPPFDDDDLAAMANEEYADEGTQWQLTSWEEVEWAFRRLARSRAALDRLADRYAEMVGRIDQWYEQEKRADTKAADYLTALIERFGVAARARDPRTATLHFPSGTIKTTLRKEPRAIAADERAALEWARDNMPEAVRLTPSLSISVLRDHIAIVGGGDTEWKAVTEDGELVPGLVVEPPGVTAKAQLPTQEEDQ